MQNWELKKKKESWPLFSNILGQPEKGKQTYFFRPYVEPICFSNLRYR